MAANFRKIWIKPEVYPLFAAMGVAVGLSAFALTRKVVADPGITISKSARSHGLADDEEAGRRYKLNYVRKSVQGRSVEITPGLNRYLSGV